MKCCICGEQIEEVFSNNALPIKDGRCCNTCNDVYVIPARIAELEIINDEKKAMIKELKNKIGVNDAVAKLALSKNNWDVETAYEWLKGKAF